MTATVYIDRVLGRLPRATPRREQIAAELRGHIAERAASGQPEAEILRQLGDPDALAESYLSAVPLVAASFGRRAVAKLVDVAVALVFIVPFAWVVWESLPEPLAPFAPIIAIVAVSCLFGVYTAIAEWQFGQTLGKRLLGLWVVKESGARIGGASHSCASCRCISRCSGSTCCLPSSPSAVSGPSSSCRRHAWSPIAPRGPEVDSRDYRECRRRLWRGPVAYAEPTREPAAPHLRGRTGFSEESD